MIISKLFKMKVSSTNEQKYFPEQQHSKKTTEQELFAQDESRLAIEKGSTFFDNIKLFFIDLLKYFPNKILFHTEISTLVFS